MCQPKFLPEPSASLDSRPPESKKRKAPSASSNRTRVLSLEELQENFHLPINEVACKLGVCVTVLKQQCRELGIVRWPYRKVRKLDNMLSALETAGPSKARPFALKNVEEERQRKISTVKNTLRELVLDPNSSAHLKLGKVKVVSKASHIHPIDGESAGQGVLEGFSGDSPALGNLALSPSGTAKGPTVGATRFDEASVEEASCALAWSHQQLLFSASNASIRQNMAADRILGLPMDAMLSEAGRDQGGLAEPQQGASLGSSLSHAHDMSAQALRPLKDLQACWAQTVSRSGSSSTSVRPDQGSSNNSAFDEALKDAPLPVHSSPNEHGASASRCSPPSSLGEDSVHGGSKSAALVELDLIARLDAPKTDTNDLEPCEEQSHLGSASGSASLPPNSPPLQTGQWTSNSPSIAAPAVSLSLAPLATGVSLASDCPAPLAHSANAAAVTVAEILQLRRQQIILQQHHQQQLLAFMAYTRETNSALLHKSADLIDAPRQTLLSSSLLRTNL